jgi:signal transduction histidine kinase
MKRIFVTIYILLLIALFTIPFGIGPIMDTIFKDEVARAERDLARGTFSLIAEKLVGMDIEKQLVELKKLQPRFGYPLGLYRIEELQIAKKDREDFFKGLIIEEDEKDMLVQRLQDSNWALTMGGPFPGDDLNVKATVLFWGLFILFLTVPALAWTFFMNRDIRKIEAAAFQFATGDHEARVNVLKISPMTQIAAAFNNFADKTQSLVQSQKDLANSVSHEIRTPLARIKFSLEMLIDEIAKEARELGYIQEIGRDVEEIESLVNETLTYAKFDREPETSEGLERNEMVSWLTAIIDAEQKSISEKKINIESLFGTDHFIKRYEPVYLGWAVRNLIRNACNYAESNIQVVFTVEDDRCVIHVDDDGPGIPSEARDRVFEPFFRMDESRNRRSGGFGLGLAIAKRITLWHRGSIQVSDSPLNGARFTITLPA